MATQSKKKAVILVVAIVVIALIGYLAYSKLTATSQGNKTAGGPATVKAMQVIKTMIHHLIMNMLVISNQQTK